MNQFIKYCIVGAIGAIITVYVNLFLESLNIPEYIDLFHLFQVPFSLGFAILCAVISNFLLNKYWTFK